MRLTHVLPLLALSLTPAGASAQKADKKGGDDAALQKIEERLQAMEKRILDRVEAMIDKRLAARKDEGRPEKKERIEVEVRKSRPDAGPGAEKKKEEARKGPPDRPRKMDERDVRKGPPPWAQGRAYGFRREDGGREDRGRQEKGRPEPGRGRDGDRRMAPPPPPRRDGFRPGPDRGFEMRRPEPPPRGKPDRRPDFVRERDRVRDQGREMKRRGGDACEKCRSKDRKKDAQGKEKGKKEKKDRR